jgi:hypothetical protein
MAKPSRFDSLSWSLEIHLFRNENTIFFLSDNIRNNVYNVCVEMTKVFIGFRNVSFH